jgi:hypothetical protein
LALSLSHLSLLFSLSLSLHPIFSTQVHEAGEALKVVKVPKGSLKHGEA